MSTRKILDRIRGDILGARSIGNISTLLEGNLQNGVKQNSLNINPGILPAPSGAVSLASDKDFGFVDYSYEYSTTNADHISFKALFVDAAGTLLEPSESVSKVFLRYGKKYGVKKSGDEIVYRFREAYEKPWRHSLLRYAGDARPFWGNILRNATGCSNDEFAEEIYQYYASGKAWRITDPLAGTIFKKLRSRGFKLAVVSNFDTRLRPIMKELGCDHWFDTITVSAEVEAEKPNPEIFLLTCKKLGVEPSSVVHVGDDRRNDVWGARDAGCYSLLWRSDVHSFSEVASCMGVAFPKVQGGVGLV